MEVCTDPHCPNLDRARELEQEVGHLQLLLAEARSLANDHRDRLRAVDPANFKPTINPERW